MADEVPKNITVAESKGDTPQGNTLAKSSAEEKPREESVGDIDEYRRELKTIRDDAEKIKKDFERLENRIDKASNFMMWMTGIIAGVFFVTGVLIAVDYAFNRGDGYQNFIDKVDNLKNNYYTMDQVDKAIENKSSSDLQSFKNCILQNQGYWPCLK
jgi:predicted phage-related endonuclease